MAPVVIEQLLNHSEGAGKGSAVASIYNRHSYTLEKRQAVDLLADKIKTLASGEMAKVIEIGRRLPADPRPAGPGIGRRAGALTPSRLPAAWWAAMPTIREWRGTPEGRCTLEMFPGRKVRELAAIVAGKRFRNETAALEFPTRLRYWALLCLSEEGRFKSSRPKRPSSASRRDELLDISRLAGYIFCRANELRDRLRALPLQSRIELGITSHPHDLTTFDSLLAAPATRKLLDLDQSAKSAAEKISRGVPLR